MSNRGGKITPTRSDRASNNTSIRIEKLSRLTFDIIYTKDGNEKSWLVDLNYFWPTRGKNVNFKSLGRTGRNAKGFKLINATIAGTTLKFEFSAEFQQLGDEWFVVISLNGLNYQMTCTLDDWYQKKLPDITQPNAWFDSNATFMLGRMEVSHLTAKGTNEVPAKMQLDLDFNWQIESAFQAKQSDSITHFSRVYLTPAGQLSRRIKATDFQILNVTKLALLFKAKSDRVVHCDSKALHSWVGQAQSKSVRDDTKRSLRYTIESTGVLQVGLLGNPGSKLHMNPMKIEVNEMLDGNKIEAILTGQIAAQKFALDIDQGVAVVSQFDNDSELAISLNFTSNQSKWRWAAIATDVRLHALDLPIEGASSAKFIAKKSNTPVIANLVLASSTGQGLTVSNLLSFSIASRTPQDLALNLDKMVLQLKRASDLLNLKLCFSGFNLTNKWQRTKKCYATKLEIKDRLDAKLSVIFPPQHLSETWHDNKDAGPYYPGIAKMRLSGDSRIVFTVHEQDKWHNKELTASKLTSWDGLTMCVHERLGLTGTVEQQLESMGIVHDTTLTQAITLIRNNFTPPNQDQTTLEMAGRLQLSPEALADAWHTPATNNDEIQVLWHARLNEQGRKSVKAVWSRWLESGVLNPGGDNQDPETDPLLVLNRNQHWEIVAQSSLLGLPGLRRTKEDKPDNSDIDDALSKLPRSRVVRPMHEGRVFDYINEVDGNPHNQPSPPYVVPLKPAPEHGVVVPSAFDDSQIILTPIGGSWVAKWKGEPPIIRRVPEVPGFKLEELAYDSYVSRTLRVQTVEKGYLFPLGIRASFVELTERRFIVFEDNDDVQALLIKRKFIVVKKPLKLYPTVHQPYWSADFPVNRLEMLTLVTPDLDTRNETDIGVERNDIPASLKKPNDVFFPRTQAGEPGTHGDVIFEWLVDDNPHPLRSRLLFVSNLIIAQPGKLKTVVNDYRSLINSSSNSHPAHPDRWHVLRQAIVGGQRMTYAPELKTGEASFDTDRWLLSVRGRLPANAAIQDSTLDEYFHMDSIMEGADQPPFYPVMDLASINIQSLNRLLGRPQALTTVKFNTYYVGGAFDNVLNPSEIYLNLLGPHSLQLNVAAQGKATGGLAQPSSYAAALSRKKGIVGGMPIANSGLNNSDTSLQQADNSSVQHPYDITQALKGTFDPKEFLLNGSKLLGLIPLGDVVASVEIDGAPNLIEELGYGALLDEISDGVDNIKERTLEYIKKLLEKGLFTNAADNIANMVGELETIINEMQPDGLEEFENLQLDSFSGNSLSRLSLVDFYPALKHRADTAIRVLREADSSIKDADTLPEISKELNQTVRACSELLDEFEKTVRNPIPPNILSFIDDIGNHWNMIKGDIATHYLTVLRDMGAKLVNDFIKPVCGEIDAELKELLLGVAPDTTCEQILRDPAHFVTQVKDSLFEQAFSSVILEVLTFTNRLQSEATAKLNWINELLVNLLGNMMLQAVEPFKDELKEPEPNLPSDPNILNHKYRYEVAQAFVNEVNDELDRLIGSPPHQPSLNWVKKALTRIQQNATEIIEDKYNSVIDTENLKNSIILKSGNTPDIEFQLFLNGVEGTKGKIKAAILSKKEQLEDVIEERIKEFRQVTLQRSASFLKSLLNSARQSLMFAEINAVFQGLEEWCSEAHERIKDFADGMIGTTDEIEEHHNNARDKIFAIRVPSGIPLDLKLKIEAARQRIIATHAELGEPLEKLKTLRGELATIPDPTNGNCIELKPFLEKAAPIIQLRIEGARQLKVLMQEVVSLSDLLIDSFYTEKSITEVSRYFEVFRTDIQELLHEIIGSIVELGGSITSVYKVASNDRSWRKIKQAMEGLNQKAQEEQVKLNAYAKELAQEKENMVVNATQLKRDLETHYQNRNYRLLLVKVEELSIYAAKNDRRVAELISQTVALPEQIITKIQDKAAAAIDNIADFLLIFHRGLVGVNDDPEAPLIRVKRAISENEVIQFLMNPEALNSFNSGVEGILKDRDALTEITRSADVKEKRLNVEALIVRWENPQIGISITHTLMTVADLIESFLQGELGAIIISPEEALKSAINALEKSLKDIVTQLVPTRYDLNYDWHTALGPFPTDKPVFSMRESNTKNLSLKSSLTFDFLTLEKEVVISGELQSFDIYLIPGFDVATIRFKGASFVSINGAKPSFDAPIEDVILGDQVKYLQALQSWMSPDDGFYVKPLFNPPGIEGGYIYSAGIIQVGTLSFINIALGVAARLYFTGKEAEFIFRFASRERPFLISSPPYGGGGHLQLKADSRKIVGFEMSLGFGAVVAFSFGPFSAQGRITAGMWIKQDPNSRQIEGFFEAVGSGNIACFSVSLVIRIGIVHSQTSGKVHGYTIISLTFKVGFLKVKFKFGAGYEDGGGSAKIALAGSALLVHSQFLEEGCSDADRYYSTNVESKSKNWGAYQRSVAAELL